jgi:putative transposase
MRRALRFGECARAPFHIDAWVVLSNHMHCLWRLPQDDADFPGRWRAIKTGFAKSLPIGEPRSPVMTRRGERSIWQRRYWEQLGLLGHGECVITLDSSKFDRL